MKDREAYHGDESARKLKKRWPVHVVNLIHDQGPIYEVLHCTMMVREFFRCITVIVRADIF
jgi:hypothetical protein